MFSDFFIEKVNKIRDSIPSEDIDVPIPPSIVTTPLSAYHPVTEQEVGKIITSSPSKS